VKRYRTIVADPPWEFVWNGAPGGRRRNQTDDGYKKMPLSWIMEAGRYLPLGCGGATLFLWTTQDVLHRGDAWKVAGAWGFGERVGEFIWRKPNFGAGAFPRIGHETCVIYKRGRGSLKPDAPRDVHSVQTWAQDYSNNSGKKHSAKPDGLYDLIEQAHEGPYLELFARRARFGWDYWGDQSLGTAEMPEAAA
jgi:N6-adenosine-specific RNA methylase IME4